MKASPISSSLLTNLKTYFFVIYIVSSIPKGDQSFEHEYVTV